MRPRQRFTATTGAPLAIDPKAYGEEFYCVDISTHPAVDTSSPHHSVVTVDGPIAYGTSCFWQTYESIKAWVAAAARESAPTVTLRINSPGGDVAGAFDCARDLRRICDAAGKRLVVHVEGQCQSAGYALASQAHEICISSTAVVGSVGVIAQYVTAIAAAAREGISHTTITSGAFKADGDPHTPIDDPMRARLQGLVDAAASEFFQLVSEGRGRPVLHIKALQAGSLMGQAAVDAGLADRIISWTDYCSQISTLGTIQPVSASADAKVTQSKDDQMSDRDDIRAALTRQCESDDPVEKARAKKALAAYDESEPEGDDKGDDKGDEDGDPKAAAEDDKAKAAVPEDTTKALAALVASNQALSAKVAKLTAKSEAQEWSELFASRPDIGKDMKDTLKALPLAQARAVLAQVPVAGVPISAAAALPVATQGANAGAVDLSNPEAIKAASAALPAEIQRAMGLHASTPGQTVYANNRLYFGGAPASEGAR